MTCEEVRDELVAYARGELAPERKAAIEEHLARCAGCGRELEGTRQVLALTQMADDSSTAALFQSIFTTAIASGASDIHIERLRSQPQVRLRIDGVLQPGPEITGDQYLALVQRVKMLASLNLAERRIPQDGRILITHAGREYDARVSTLPQIFGEGVVIRVFDRASVLLGLDRLGFCPDTLDQILGLLARPSGLIIAAGPTGSGKTTTLYSMLQHVTRPQVKVLTIEDPVEYALPGMNQMQVNRKADLTFAAAARACLRHDPDILLIGEIRDLETAQVCVQAALTGHLVFTTLHTHDAAGALVRLLDAGVEPFLVTSAVIGVISQRLARKVCPECRTAYNPPPESIAHLGLPASGAMLHRGTGCAHCHQTGYRGRVTVAEVLTPSGTVNDLVLRRAPDAEIRAAAQAAGMRTMREDALRKALDGVISIDEALRVTAPAAV